MKFPIVTTVFFVAMAKDTTAQNTMVKMCLNYDNESGHARSDPIINQNCASGHVHTFYGPQNFHPNTSYEDIRDTHPRYSSSPYRENQSLYWHPSIYEVVGNSDGSTTYTRVNNLDSSTYYRWDNTVSPLAEAFPPEFRMIAHSNDPRADEHAANQDNMPIRTECCNFGDTIEDETCEFWNRVVLPDNRRCDDLGIGFAFPTCWNGELGIDNDHKDHVVYALNGRFDGPCPASHPRRLPEAQIFIRVNGYDSTDKSYMFSDNSDVFHADFFNGWQEGKLQEIMDNCQLDDSDDFGYNPPCACTPDDQFDSRFLTENNRVASAVCDVDVRELIIDEATDVTNTLPMGSCQGPPLKPKSWTDIDNNTFDCAQTPTAPIPAPTAPVTPPTGGGCVDQPLAFKNKSKQNCDWVAQKAQQRCSKNWQGKRLSEYCPVACGTCDDAPAPTQPVSPVATPTAAPVAAPTGGDCADSSSFKDNKGKNRNCSWAAKKAKRCQLYGEHCPVSCGTCQTTPTQAPVPSPTAPVPSPTQAPVSSPTSPSEPVCYDRTLAYRNNNKKDCSWVAKNSRKRCDLEWEEKPLWEWCPSACGLECRECCEVTTWECEETQSEAVCNAAFETCTQSC